MNDLISRAAAIEAVMSAGPSYYMTQTNPGFQETHTKLGAFAFRTDIGDAIRALPAASQPEAEPVAWRWRWNGGDEPDIWAYREDPIESNQHRTVQPLYTHPTPAPVVPAEGLDALIAAAKAEAEKAMRKFPQPNYVISKVAEEAGEVVKAAIHCAEGRETQENVVSEIRQAMAMLFRLYLEGDQVHGLPPLRAQQPAAPVSGVTVQEAGWQPIETAPYDIPVRVKLGKATIIAAVLRKDASMNTNLTPCDQWQAYFEGEHPECWSDGACWENNADEVMSLQPSAWSALLPDGGV